MDRRAALPNPERRCRRETRFRSSRAAAPTRSSRPCCRPERSRRRSCAGRRPRQRRPHDRVQVPGPTTVPGTPMVLGVVRDGPVQVRPGLTHRSIGDLRRAPEECFDDYIVRIRGSDENGGEPHQRDCVGFPQIVGFGWRLDVHGQHRPCDAAGPCQRVTPGDRFRWLNRLEQRRRGDSRVRRAGRRPARLRRGATAVSRCRRRARSRR